MQKEKSEYLFSGFRNNWNAKKQIFALLKDWF
jgi:hypothetical protein